MYKVKAKGQFFSCSFLIYGLLALLLCSCASTSQKNAQAAQKCLEDRDYDMAFDQTSKALSGDIKNKDAIKMFPDVFNRVQGYHNDNITKAEQSNSWDTVSEEYDRLADINEESLELIDKVKTSYKDQLADSDQGTGMFSSITSAFSVPWEDLVKIASLSVPNISEEKDIAHQKAGAVHYDEGQRLAAENAYRSASNEFAKAMNFVPNFKDAQSLTQKYKRMADHEDALTHYNEGQKLADKKSYRAASDEFNSALRFVADFKDAQPLAQRYSQMADQEDAQRHYREGQRLAGEKSYRAAFNEFSNALRFVSNFKDAQSLAEKYKQMADEADAQKHYESGKQLMKQKKYSLAYDQFVKANEYVYGYKDVLDLMEESKNKMPPSEQEIIKAVEKCLSRDGVPVSWVGNLMGGGKTTLSSISIVRIGIYNESKQYWPMIIRVQGSSLLNDPFNQGKSVSFDKNGDFVLFRDDYGDWQASLKGGMFQ